MDITLQPTEVYTAEDRSWLASKHGTDAPATVTLDTSAFTEGTHYPSGFVPSGTVLGKITATGLYGPYNNGASDGTEVAVGFLYSNTKMRASGPDVGAPLLWHGAIKSANLPANSGLDANGRTDLAGRFWIN